MDQENLIEILNLYECTRKKQFVSLKLKCQGSFNHCTRVPALWRMYFVSLKINCEQFFYMLWYLCESVSKLFFLWLTKLYRNHTRLQKRNYDCTNILLLKPYQIRIHNFNKFYRYINHQNLTSKNVEFGRRKTILIQLKNYIGRRSIT